MLSFSLIPEPMLIPVARDEEDSEDLYTDDFFWFHERGVDLIFIFAYLHLFRKLYLQTHYFEQEFAWKTGTFLFMLIQVITFLGLVLCCTHLSDITLKIASNTLHTFFGSVTKVYWWLFTDKNLNTDTVVRLAYLHYIGAFFIFFLSTNHAIDMHYDWKSDASYDGIENELQWWNEVVLNEVITFFDFAMAIFFFTLFLYNEPEALSYEIFMWGDIGLITDPKFNQVAPHWYFRPLMAFLLVVPHSILGVAGLIYFFFVLYHQLTLQQNESTNHYIYKNKNMNLTNSFYLTYSVKQLNAHHSFLSYMMFYFFVMTCLYTTTFLPNGKYYQLLGGNNVMLFAFFFILSYLTFPQIRNPQWNIFSTSNLIALLINLRFKMRLL